jgi:hypothetical protein
MGRCQYGQGGGQASVHSCLADNTGYPEYSLLSVPEPYPGRARYIFDGIYDLSGARYLSDADSEKITVTCAVSARATFNYHCCYKFTDLHHPIVVSGRLHV